ncbi:MAG TPA: F0F1 ATP synthase subunit B [Candidatus Gracilibacteria bacterium]|nr:F0F1 ATP synthase subunit B [Candidatus Gracilibacteria bacterium]
MNNFSLIQVAYASGNEAAAETVAETKAEHGEAKGGLEIQPTTVAIQALNIVLLIVILNAILYKPLVELINKREKRIKDGVENAEKAENMLKESNQIRTDMIKEAKTESQDIIEKARKSGEEVKSGIINEAQTEADKIIKSGSALVESEKAKAMQELKASAVTTIVMAAERLLKEKIDPSRDAKLIEDSLNSYSAGLLPMHISGMRKPLSGLPKNLTLMKRFYMI